ncbi:MAG: peptidoglycan-binding domain-containing protein [Minisyncoccia bacterium]|jgi:peptidoglycan hydrolase-like protein with peptidoglycan-binding domain
MNIKTKIVAALTLAVLVAPGISLAQTMSVAQLQAEIQSLTAQLTQLEAQLTAAGGTTTAWCYTFNNNLSIGMSGSAVTALQTAIQKDGESVTVNGTFDDQTAAAVTTFQEKYQSAILAPYGLSNGTGYAGTTTRAELNSLFGCSGSNPVTPPIIVNPIVPTSSSPITACPMFVPYCPYGGHSVVESNGCSETVCNPAPTAPSTIYPAGCTSFSGYSSTNGESCAPATATPYISQVNPTTAASGATVTITGQNFDGNSYISIGNVPTGPESFPIAATSQTATSLTFVVPSNLSGATFPLYVAEHNSNLVSNEGGITITTPVVVQQVPTITNLSSNQGTATSSITIYGTNLTSGGNPTIQFYSSSGALAGTIYFISMGYISPQSIVFTPTISNSLLSALSPGMYQIDVLTPNGTSNPESFTLLAPVVQAPVINSFSAGAGPTFSLSAYNYNTITFQAQCGNFVAVVQPQNGSPALYPTGSASICNAPQTYSSSSFNETSSIAPQMINVPLSLYNAQGVVDGSITMVGSPAGSNNSGSATLTVNVCNSAGVCVQQTASFPIYAKG